jgi:hypothetical protein
MTFEEWLVAQLERCGVYGGAIEDDDVATAIERYQRIRSLPVTGEADEATIYHLRQRASTRDDCPLIIFDSVPVAVGKPSGEVLQ